MATLAALKKKLAALEAQVEQVTKAEMQGAINKVLRIMSDFGLTVEHLTASPAGGRRIEQQGAAKPQAVSAATKANGAKPPKYRDPATGVTWAGVGRAPAWIANAKNRDEFLINKTAGAEASAATAAPAVPATAAKKASKREKAASAVKRVASKAVPAKKGAAEKVAPVGRASAKKIASKNDASKVAPKKTGTKRAFAKKQAA